MKHIGELIDKVERIKDYYSVGPVQRAAVEDFADNILDNILRVVAAQALNGESAMDVFINLKEVYTGEVIRNNSRANLVIRNDPYDF